jgi:hypothetical protein
VKRLLQCVLAVALVASGEEARPVDIQTLVAAGDPVPGAPGQSFEAPGFGAVGDGGTTFTAWDTSLPGVERLWVADVEGNLTPITHTGAAAPGATGASFAYILAATPLAPGLVGVTGQLGGTGVDETNDRGFWLWDEAAGLRLLAREGDVVPGTNGARLSEADWDWSWTPAGEVFLPATLVGGDATDANDSVLLRADASGIRMFLREGDPAPGLPGLRLGRLLVTGSGDGLVIQTRSAPFPADAIYLADAAGNLDPIYAAGDPAPGIPGAIFTSLDVAPAAPGAVPAFIGEIAGDFRSDEGIWFVDANGELALAARESQPLEGGFVLRTLNSPVVDGVGRVVFEGNAVDADFDVFSSLLSYDPETGRLEIVARVETPIPCLEASFAGFFRNPFANARGDVAVWGAIEGADIPRDSAVYARLPDETFEVVAREQQSFEVRPGVFKTIRSVNLSNSSWRNALADDGRLGFHLEFTDRTAALFVAHLAEPGDRGLLRARNSHAAERARCAHVAPAMRSR